MWGNQKRLRALLALAAIMLPALTSAASLTLTVHNVNDQPVAQAVAALIPLDAAELSSPAMAMMDQRNNTFVPGVLAIRTNTLVHFPNSDDVRHHVYSFSPAKRFELRLYHGHTAEPVLFDQPGQVVLGCNIHDSMLAYIYVVDSEHFGVTDARGNLLIKNLPAGEYRMEIQHPALAETQSINEKIIIAGDSISRHVTLTGSLNQLADEPADDELKNLFKRKL